MKLLSTLLVLSAVFASSNQATNVHEIPGHNHDELCQGFLPQNTLWIEADQKSRFTGIDEAQFNAVISEIEAVYAPIIASRGGTLQINRKWTDGTVNANASRSGSTYVVNMYGGLARHKAITADGFALVLCHEIGHHIGGAPTYSSGAGGGWGGGSNSDRNIVGNAWASNEGQSDYFATAKCFRNVYGSQDNSAYVNAETPEYVAKTCKASFPNSDDYKLCVRSSAGGQSLANLFKDLRNLQVPVTFQTPDTKVVTKTYDGHPQPQCRLDTYFRGTICTADERVDLGYDDHSVGACTADRGEEKGARPLCWYKVQEIKEQQPETKNPIAYRR
ncbi:MAG: hypothetical protein JNM93_06075 [Bacteriovoracaceae bacterium]|nr:hypothetical protein [Bacteriovoracaceae bacterium]